MYIYIYYGWCLSPWLPPSAQAAAKAQLAQIPWDGWGWGDGKLVAPFFSPRILDIFKDKIRLYSQSGWSDFHQLYDKNVFCQNSRE